MNAEIPSAGRTLLNAVERMVEPAEAIEQRVKRMRSGLELDAPLRSALAAQALLEARGNKSEAARLLRVDRGRLLRALHERKPRA